MRHGEHPLAHRHGREHTIHEVRCLFGHAPPAAARAEAASFAREWHQALEGAVAAADPREAPAQGPTAEELAELALDEAGHAGAVRGGGRLGEEALEVRAHDMLEQSPRSGARLVGAKQHGEAEPASCRRAECQAITAAPLLNRSAPAALETSVQRPVAEHVGLAGRSPAASAEGRGPAAPDSPAGTPGP